jgi:hypothetical protein
MIDQNKPQRFVTKVLLDNSSFAVEIDEGGILVY